MGRTLAHENQHVDGNEGERRHHGEPGGSVRRPRQHQESCGGRCEWSGEANALLDRDRAFDADESSHEGANHEERVADDCLAEPGAMHLFGQPDSCAQQSAGDAGQQ